MKEINLLPKQYRTSIVHHKTKQQFGIAAGILFFLLVSSVIFVEFTYRRFQQQSVYYDGLLQDPKFISGEKLETELRQFKTTVTQVDGILTLVDQTQQNFTPVIVQLSTQLPASLRLEQLHYTENIKQLVVTYESTDKTQIPIFIDELDHYPQFKEIRMTSLDKNNFDMTLFTLEITLDQEG